jgi:hypothetical protein
MSTDLVKIEQPSALAQLGAFDTSDPLFELRPGTVVINQPSTRDENAKRGHLRIVETGDQYEEMRAALIMTPEAARSYYIGEGALKRKPENLMCFNRNTKNNPGPDARSKDVQALTCSTCPKASWDAWRLYAEKHPGQPVPRNLLPECDPYYYIVLVDTVFQMPLQMYIRGGSIEPFKAGMQNLARNMAKLKAVKKVEPLLYDIAFTISTVRKESGDNVTYALKFSDFKAVTDEERLEFGVLFNQFAERGKRSEEVFDEQDAAKKVDKAQTEINAAIGDDEEIPV